MSAATGRFLWKCTPYFLNRIAEHRDDGIDLSFGHIERRSDHHRIAVNAVHEPQAEIKNEPFPLCGLKDALGEVHLPGEWYLAFFILYELDRSHESLTPHVADDVNGLE